MHAALASVSRPCTMRKMETPHPLFSQASKPRCRTCGFALTGLPEVGNCPECGRLYNSDNSVAFDPPSVGRALGYIGLPLAAGLIFMLIGIASTAHANTSSAAYFAFALVWVIAGISCVAWTAWRTAGLLRAIAETQPTHTPGAQTTSRLAHAGMVIAVLIFIGAVCLGVIGTLALGGCLIALGQ